jgi:type I restriction enzyme S subunit
MSRIQKRLEEIAPQSAQKNINLAILRELPIPVPPIDEQNVFRSRIRDIEAQKKTLRNAEEGSANLFHSLQHRAFNDDLTTSSLKEAAQ